MNKHPVVFIAFEESDNLGIGYLASVLSEAGFDSLIVDVRNSKENIHIRLLETDPLIVGFSVVFQYHINRFVDLVAYLRESGINCHFTAGGQYASLKHSDLYKIIPSLDSIVRFEGEYTLLELVRCIYSGRDWRHIDGISYKNNNNLITNPFRHLETDLDKFPFPLRSPPEEYAFGKKFANILAGRGCLYDCIYCNTKKFYLPPPGPVKRLRKPEMVVSEMEMLFKEKGCSVFLFQDDDFPVKTVNGNEWVTEFCNEIERKKLKNRIMWKINCRPDEITYDSFDLMKKAGLFQVFIGIEDGTDSGLKMFNKHMTATTCLEGIDILKNLGIGFDYGFMLFHPYSDFITIGQNLRFLRQICGDGYTPVTFLKMLPFFKTKIEEDLRNEGRLIGNPGFYDYKFSDQSIDRYYEFFENNFMEWLRAPDGLLNISQWARNFILLLTFIYGYSAEIGVLSDYIRKITSESNNYLLDIMEEIIPVIKSAEFNSGDFHVLSNMYRKKIGLRHTNFKDQINNCISQMLLIDKRKTMFANFVS